jgi:hypothetical protein
LHLTCSQGFETNHARCRRFGQRIAFFRDKEEQAMRALIAMALVILPFLGRSSAQGRKVHHNA